MMRAAAAEGDRGLLTTDKGGMVFMHNGDNMVRYPDHGAHKHCLVRDICRGLMANSGSMINRF